MSQQYSNNLVYSTNVAGGPVQYSQSNTVGRTLIDSSSPEHPIQLASSNQIVSQILNTTQGSPTRQSKTFVYRSESPIRSSQYGKHVVNVSHIEKGQAPLYVSQSTIQNPIYVEKIVKVESSNTSELNLLRQRISAYQSTFFYPQQHCTINFTSLVLPFQICSFLNFQQQYSFNLTLDEAFLTIIKQDGPSTQRYRKEVDTHEGNILTRQCFFQKHQLKVQFS